MKLFGLIQFDIYGVNVYIRATNLTGLFPAKTPFDAKVMLHYGIFEDTVIMRCTIKVITLVKTRVFNCFRK